MSLATLPSELYLAILSHVPPSHLQVTTLNLSRAIPLSPVPLRPLFEHISVSHQQQLPQLYRKLKYGGKELKNAGNGVINDESTWVKSFSVLIWQVDADVLGNVLGLLPVLERLSIRIGPVFSPEHLQDMFIKPMFSLNTLNLRFCPYVRTATYYQFLKGSYFDSTLESISTWPNSSLTRLSIVQDTLPRFPEGTHHAFAQPIVFFSLIPLTRVSLSPTTQKVTHVRLRIPSRQLVQFIASKPVDMLRYPFPNAIFLDISTSFIRGFNELESLLNFVGGGQLRYLLLDHTGLCDGSARDWEMLGRTCALAGVKYSRDCEKAMKSWTQADAMAGDNDNQNEIIHQLPAQDQPPARRGRRGLATATVSLRDRPTAPITSALPPPHPGSRPKAIRIRPSPPHLSSLCINLPLPPGQQHSTDDVRTRKANALTDFARGWSEGIGQLRSIWTRLRQSQSNGVKVFQLHVGGHSGLSEGINVLNGLVELNESINDEHWEELHTLEPPVLCLAGPRTEGYVGKEWSGHPEGCGHRISWDVWSDHL